MRSKTNNPGTSEYIPEKYRCRFTSRRGPRCNRRIFNSANGLCASHSYIISKLEAAESGAITEKLFDTTPYLQTREEVRSSLAQLYRLVAERRVKRPDGALLAYIGSLVLQALPYEQQASGSQGQSGIVNVIWDNPNFQPAYPDRQESAPDAQAQPNTGPQG